MPVVHLTRRATFAASHRLHSDALSSVENLDLFGKCNNRHGHGHNYVIEVTVRGEIDPRTGIVMNLTKLKESIDRCILQVMDHKHLNLDLEEFGELNPTAENIAVVCWGLLKPDLGGLLQEVVIRETENNFVRYRGEE